MFFVTSPTFARVYPGEQNKSPLSGLHVLIAIQPFQFPFILFAWITSCGEVASLTPTSIKFNRFLKLILLEHKPLLACFGFMASQKWLVSGKINLRKRLNLIDVGAESRPFRRLARRKN
jgi:hypothetical protein